MNSYYVYKHTTPSGKVYIGITKQELRKRWKHGKGYEGCTAFYRAVVKYGWDNIRHEVLYSDLDRETACAIEQQLIAKYDSTNPLKGYNLTTGGDHYEYTPEVAQRLGESLKKAYKERPELRAHLSEIQKGRKSSQQSSEKKRAAMLAFYKEHPEKRKECGNSFRGKKRGQAFAEALGARKSKPVICIDTNCIYKSIKQAAEAEGGSPAGITAVLRGRVKTCAGKKYKYYLEEQNANEN